MGGAPWASGRVGTSSKPLADVTLHALCYSYRQTETGAASEQLLQRVTPALVPNTLLPSSTSPRALKPSFPALLCGAKPLWALEGGRSETLVLSVLL